MSNPLFHNNTVNINDVWFESHNSLLQQLCDELAILIELTRCVRSF